MVLGLWIPQGRGGVWGLVGGGGVWLGLGLGSGLALPPSLGGAGLGWVWWGLGAAGFSARGLAGWGLYKARL